MKKTKEQLNKEAEARKAFAKKIKSLSSKEAVYSLRFENAHVMSDGKAYINVDLTRVESPFSIYSYGNRLDSEIYSYIDQEAEFLAADIPLVVNFVDGGRFDNETKSKIAKTVVRHYRLKYEDTRLNYQKNVLFAYITLGIGLILFAAYVLLNIFLQEVVPNTVLFEIIEIVSWAFIWETVDRLALSGIFQKNGVFNAGQLALLEVTFGEPIINK